jgi:NADPH-dependent 2,4-dienoyl-CoA reductase/sulfur reductase-like enzyme
MSQSFDILVIGGGPAGIAAAVRGAESGVATGIVDDNATLGGQIWRRAPTENAAQQAAEWHERLQKAKVSVLCGTRVFDQPERGLLLAERDNDMLQLAYRKLVLATGARERFLPFPGWTLPNVMGAGGLQAMVKASLPIRGKRVIVAGTGPLLLAVAAYLRKHGAEIPIICEQASWSRLARFGLTLLADRQKATQARQLKRDLAGVPFAANAWPVAVHGQTTVERVTITRNGKSEEIACDYLACGFHLVPNTELAALLGCQMRGGFVEVDDLQRTTLPGVFCAGEPTSIGGLELSLIEGEIAGLAASDRLPEAQRLFPARKKRRSFARRLDRTFSLRNELRSLPSPDTIICRCEDVPHSRLAEHTGWRAAKLHTRCGMGPCQGRICGPATEFLFRWNPDSVRPPLFPARVSSLAAMARTNESERTNFEEANR